MGKPASAHLTSLRQIHPSGGNNLCSVAQLVRNVWTISSPDSPLTGSDLDQVLDWHCPDRRHQEKEEARKE